MDNLFILTNQLGEPRLTNLSWASKREAKQHRDRLNKEKFGCTTEKEVREKHNGAVPNGWLRVSPGPHHVRYVGA